MLPRYVCVDFGSTFTKVVAVDADGHLVATGSARTTIETDVMDGLDHALADAEVALGGEVDVLACSSAGGGLRIAVVGYEREITAEAGYRVGLSAGGRVCHVTSGELSAEDIDGLRAAEPDVLLLVGGPTVGTPTSCFTTPGRSPALTWGCPSSSPATGPLVTR